MIHRIKSVGKLYNDTITAQKKIVEGSAVDVLSNIEKAINNFKENWKGKDAGIRIQELILTYNEMIDVRNNLALICAGLTRVAKGYHEVNNLIKKPKKEEELVRLRYEAQRRLEEYSDNRDLIDINENVLVGLKHIDIARSALDTFIKDVSDFHTVVLENWEEGAGRDQLIHKFNLFINDMGRFEEALIDTSNNVHRALENYSNLHAEG